MSLSTFYADNVAPTFDSYVAPLVGRYRPSFYLLFAALAVAAKHADPSFVNLLVGVIVVVLAIGMRFVAKIEGQQPHENTAQGKMVKAKPSLIMLLSSIVLCAFSGPSGAGASSYELLFLAAILLVGVRSIAKIEGAAEVTTA